MRFVGVCVCLCVCEGERVVVIYDYQSICYLCVQIICSPINHFILGQPSPLWLIFFNCRPRLAPAILSSHRDFAIGLLRGFGMPDSALTHNSHNWSTSQRSRTPLLRQSTPHQGLSFRQDPEYFANLESKRDEHHELCIYCAIFPRSWGKNGNLKIRCYPHGTKHKLPESITHRFCCFTLI